MVLPLAANSGQYVATGSSYSNSPRVSVGDGERRQARRGRKQVDQRVPLPGSALPRVGGTAPQVDLVVNDDCHCGTDLATAAEVFGERVPNCLVRGRDVTVDDDHRDLLAGQSR